MADRALNDPAEIPPELDRWNWGAFFLNWIWGIGNSTLIALLSLIPVVGIIMLFVLGARGSRWAWRNRAWRDAEHFRKTQRAWAIAGLVIWLAVIGGTLGLVGSIPYLLKSSGAYQMTMDAVRSHDEVKALLGDDISAGFWVSGNVNIEGGGTGEANLSIPVHGDSGSGRALSQARRVAGKWDLRLVVVRIDGSDVPIVIINKDQVQVPGAPMNL